MDTKLKYITDVVKVCTVSLLRFPPKYGMITFLSFFINDLLLCLRWMPLISDIWMILTSMCVCQHFSQSQPTSRKCKQWILTSSSLSCTTASIPSRLAEYSFSCYMHRVHDESNFQLTSTGCFLAPRNIQKVSLGIRTNTFLKFCLFTFSSVCPKRKIQCSTTFCQWTLEPFGHLYWIKGILQAWKGWFSVCCSTFWLRVPAGKSKRFLPDGWGGH